MARLYHAWKRFEQHIADKWKQNDGTAQRTTSGRQGQDTGYDIDAEWEGIPFIVECKSSVKGSKRFTLEKEWFDHLDQALQPSNDRIPDPDTVPVLVFNFYRSTEIYCLRGYAFWKLLETAYQAGIDKERATHVCY